MSVPGTPPPSQAVLVELDAATDRMLQVAGRLPDSEIRAPSSLPGWTRGHVLTHLARNADALGNLLTWAETGVVTPMYVSMEARSADIAEGATRGASDQQADLASSAQRLRDHLDGLPEHAAHALLAMPSGAELRGWQVPLLRIREVEVHLVDLDVGITVGDWPGAFTTRTLDELTPGVLARGESSLGWLEAATGYRWTIGTAATGLRGPEQALLGWLMGRTDGADLVPEGRNDVPPPPPWH